MTRSLLKEGEAPVLGYVRTLRTLLDQGPAYDALNHPQMRDAMRAFVKGTGNATRPQLATQAFCFAIELERERVRAMLQLGTWPCHDDPDPEELVRRMFEEARAEQEAAEPPEAEGSLTVEA